MCATLTERPLQNSIEPEAGDHRPAAGEALARSHKAAFGLRLRAGLSASNRVWESNPWFHWWCDFQSRVESANTQNRSGELPMPLLA